MLSKEDFRCPHRHNGFEHSECYRKYIESARGEGVGYLDIETSQLRANFGDILSWFIKHRGQNKYESYVLQKSDFETPDRDREAVRKLLESIQKFDKIVTYYGIGFDRKFILTRAVAYGFQWLPEKTVQHLDLYWPVKNNLLLHSCRLDSVADLLDTITQKTPLKPHHWEKAGKGDLDALAYIVDHNKKDVRILEQVHDALIRGNVPMPKARRWL